MKVEEELPNIWMKDSSWFVRENSRCLERDWHVPTQIWWCSPYFSVCVCKMSMSDTLGHMLAIQLKWLYWSILTVISWSEVMENHQGILKIVNALDFYLFNNSC